MTPRFKSFALIGPSIIFGVIAILGCSMKPQIFLETKGQGADTGFQIRAEGINGLLDLRIWEEETKTVIWQVNLNYFNGSHLGYGEVPGEFKTFNGATGSAKQLFPNAAEHPSRLPAGKSFIAALIGQYDTVGGASVRVFYFRFSTDAEGQILKIVPVVAPAPKDLPK